MSRLFRGRVAAAWPAVLVLPILAAVSARAADDFVQEDTPPPVVAPQPRVLLMPPLRLEMRQLQRQAAEAPPGETRKAAYLGVATRSLAPELRAQTDLPAGVGLLIDAVSPDSPAARAGVKRFDVLHKFDDQLVCATEQLTALVEAAGKDKEVPLTLLRGGREQVVTVTLGEREVAMGGAGGPAFGFGALDGLEGGAGLPFDLGELLGGALAEGLPGLGGDVQAQVQRQVQEALEQVQAQALGGDVQARVLQIYPGGGRSQSVTVMSDGDGSVEIRETDGKRTVTIKDPAGQEVYSGPLGDAADREQIPKAFRDKVRSAEERLGGRRQPSQKPAAKKPAAEAEADEI
jgi:serine protease Do